MNKTTRAIRDKGYELEEFLNIERGESKKTICLRTYRNYEKPSHAMHETLNKWIDELEGK